MFDYPSAMARNFDSEGAVPEGLEATRKQNTPLPDNQRNEQKEKKRKKEANR